MTDTARKGREFLHLARGFMTEGKQKRTVFAPQPILISSLALPANRVISVEVDDNEDVEWMWTSLPEGTKYISGYTIVKKAD